MAKVAVLEFGQHPEDSPIHFISQPLAEAFKAYYHNGKKAVSEIRKGLLAIQANVTFGKLKALLRSNGPRLIPSILPPRKPDWHFTAYPIQDQRTRPYLELAR
jgi:hypothetical protein